MLERRTAAIKFTDIFGYPTLMSSNEDIALDILSETSEIKTQLISQYGEILIKKMEKSCLVHLYFVD